jgi:hypothetical protein
LFLFAVLGALAIILVNLAIAARLPEGTGDGRNAFRDLFERLGQGAADARRGPARPGSGAPRTVTFGPDEFPDLTPIARVVLIGLAIFVALTIGASVAASWSTILLWVKSRSLLTRRGGAAIDPVFGRDISFFLFDLPFLRLIQSLVSGIVVATLLAVGIRYLMARHVGSLRPPPRSGSTSASSPVCSCCPSRSATSSTSTSSRTAAAGLRWASRTPIRTPSSSRMTS